MQDDNSMGERGETSILSCQLPASHLVDESGRPLEDIVGSVKRMLDIIAKITETSQEQAAVPDRAEQMSLPMEEP